MFLLGCISLYKHLNESVFIKVYPNGGTVLVLENIRKGPNVNPHSIMVAENAERAVSETNIDTMDKVIDKSPADESGIQNFIIEKVENFYKRYTMSFEEITQSKEDVNVVNISEGVDEYSLLEVLDKYKSIFLKMATPEEKARLFSNTTDKETDLNLSEAETYIDESLEAGKDRINKAKADLEEKVEKLKTKNIAVVTSVGNNAEDIAVLGTGLIPPSITKDNNNFSGIQFEKNEGENFLASVKGIIGVGESKVNGNGKLTESSSDIITTGASFLRVIIIGA